MPWLAIGTDTNDPIDDGASFDGNPVTISCSVHPNGAGYDVSLRASLDAGQGSGDIALAGATVSADLSAVSSGFSASFNRLDTGGEFVEANCAWDFGGQPEDLDPAHVAGSPFGIGPGRAWGNLTCPLSQDVEQGWTCLARAELRFENCAE